MKKILLLKILFGCVAIASCQEIKSNKYNIKCKVNDIYGKPVMNAKIIGGSEKLTQQTPVLQSESVTVESYTNEVGVGDLHLETYSSSPAGILISKSGYYTMREELNFTSKKAASNEYSVEINATLKPIVKPIPMVFHNVVGIPIHVMNSKIGIDLELGEACAPLGKGVNADLYVTMSTKTSTSSLEYSAEIEFANSDDGFIEFDGSKKSFNSIFSLVSDYKVPNEPMKKSIFRTTSSNQNSDFFKNNISNEKKCYYFRARTVRNTQGVIENCNYGKIYGPIKIYIPSKFTNLSNPPLAFFTMDEVYFNPRSMENNVECDPTRNLSTKRLPSGEEIKIQRP